MYLPHPLSTVIQGGAQPGLWGAQCSAHLLSCPDSPFLTPSNCEHGRRQVALDIGFSLERGRLDVSVHPFTVSLAESTLVDAVRCAVCACKQLMRGLQ